MRSFNVSIMASFKKTISIKQPSCRSFGTPCYSCDATVMLYWAWQGRVWAPTLMNNKVRRYKENRCCAGQQQNSHTKIVKNKTNHYDCWNPLTMKHKTTLLWHFQFSNLSQGFWMNVFKVKSLPNNLSDSKSRKLFTITSINIMPDHFKI